MRLKLTMLFSVALLLCALGAGIFTAAGASALAPVQTVAAATDGDCSTLDKCTLISKYVNPFIKLLAIVAGVSAIGGLIYGGILYSSSGGDPQKVTLGKKKIMNALIGFVAFLFLAAFIQFASPGGAQTTPRGGVASAASCGNNFLGLKPWFAYLDNNKFDEYCAVTGFEVLPKSGMSDIVPVALVIVDDMLRIAGLVAVIFIIVAGVKYITSQGEPDATKQAKDTIINAIIGLVIAIISSGVITYVGHQLVK